MTASGSATDMTSNRTRDPIDSASLDVWMRENVDGYKGPLTIKRFEGGQSNPTFKLETPGVNYVLRRKPLGKLLPSAHAVDREFRVMKVLHSAGFEVPRPFALCMDDAVIGSAFFVMSALDGRVFWNQQAPESRREDRRNIYISQAQTLARLHSFDPQTVGLGDYGKPGNLFERQMGRWIKQYRLAQTDDIPDMERLIEWLPTTLPAQQRTTIVHGDYQLHNIMFHPTEPRVLGVLDWELSTTGDPLADVSYMLMQWRMSGGRNVGLLEADLDGLNIPPMEEAAAAYCEVAGGSRLPDLNWYFAFNLFRLASITQGIVARIKEGNAASKDAHGVIDQLRPLARNGWEHALKAGAS